MNPCASRIRTTRFGVSGLSLGTADRYHLLKDTGAVRDGLTVLPQALQVGVDGVAGHRLCLGQGPPVADAAWQRRHQDREATLGLGTKQDSVCQQLHGVLTPPVLYRRSPLAPHAFTYLVVCLLDVDARRLLQGAPGALPLVAVATKSILSCAARSALSTASRRRVNIV